MTAHILVSLLAVALLAGCPATEKQKPKTAKGKSPGNSLPENNPAGDVAFQAFVGRLKIAVATHDLDTLSSMMTPDFGYRWDDAPEGENPFSFWDEKNLWGRLSSILSERWVQHDGFMVVPPQLAQQADYPGYRAGIAMYNGAWRFAYFVPAPPQD